VTKEATAVQEEAVAASTEDVKMQPVENGVTNENGGSTGTKEAVTSSTPAVVDAAPEEEKKQTQQNTYLSQGADGISKPATVEQ
jgi:hypothetical protein